MIDFGFIEADFTAAGFFQTGNRLQRGRLPELPKAPSDTSILIVDHQMNAFNRLNIAVGLSASRVSFANLFLFWITLLLFADSW